MASFHKKSDELFKEIINFIDTITNDIIDVNFTENVIEIDYDGQVFVINKQNQIQEVWLSSPISGPYHFRYCDSNGIWIDRNNIDLLGLFKKEFLILVNS
jgi:iron donor protein CyaY